MNAQITFNIGKLSEVSLSKFIEIDDSTKKKTTTYKTKWALFDILNSLLIGDKPAETTSKYDCVNSPISQRIQEVTTYLLNLKNKESIELRYKTETTVNNAERLSNRRAAKTQNDKQGIIENSMSMEDAETHLLDDQGCKMILKFYYELGLALIEAIDSMAESFNLMIENNSQFLRFVDFTDCLKTLRFLSLNAKIIFDSDDIYTVLKINTLASYQDTQTAFFLAHVPAVQVHLSDLEKKTSSDALNTKLEKNNVSLMRILERTFTNDQDGTERKKLTYYVMIHSGAFVEFEAYNIGFKQCYSPKRTNFGSPLKRPTKFNISSD